MLTTNRLRVIIGAFLLVSFILTASCGGSTTAIQPGTQDGIEDTGGMTTTVAILVRAMSIEDLAKESGTIVIGTVRQVSAAQWSSPDGKRPPPDVRAGPHSPIIFRDALVQVEQYVKNPLEAKELAVHLYGGQVGQDVMRFSEEVSLESSERVLLFLGRSTGPEMARRAGYRVWGSIQGKFKITDGVAVGIEKYGSFPLPTLIARIKSAATQ